MKKFLTFPVLALPFVVTAFGAFTACTAVGPASVQPALELPERYADAGAGPAASRPPQSQWWQAFNDPVLSRLIQRALAASPDIEIAGARLRQARAIQGMQDAASGPTLGAGVKVTSDQLSKNSEMFANFPSKNINTRFTNSQIGFDASWELDLFGHQHQQHISEAAAARGQAGQERLRDAGFVVAAEVARAYIELRIGQQRLALAQDNLKNFDESLRLAVFSAKVGEGTQIEVQRAALSRKTQEAGLPGLEIGIRSSLAALAVLNGEPIQQLGAQLSGAGLVLGVPPAPAAGLPSDLLKRRPDLRAAERELAAAGADIGIAIAEQYPRFSLTGNGGWSSVQIGSLMESASRFWSIGPQLTLPIFNGDRLKNQVKTQQAAFDANRAGYRKAVMSALADVELGLTRFARSEERRRQMLDAEERQRRILALTERQLKAGEVAKGAVLEARKGLAGQQDQVLQAHGQSLTALVALYKALGGGWDEGKSCE